MIERYQLKKMKQIWSPKHRLATWFKVEMVWVKYLLLEQNKNLEAQAFLQSCQEFTHKIDWHEFHEKMLQHEKTTKHDVVAFLYTLDDYMGKNARLIHLGLTSSDVVDTAFALIIKESSEEILLKLKALIMKLFSLAKRHKTTQCLGRTHGQPADELSFGMKLLGFTNELIRGYHRVQSAQREVCVGKLSGAVGKYNFSPEIEQKALNELGIGYEEVATQVVCRDRHSNYFAQMSILASSLERLAHEIRLLSHGQIMELSEGFSAGQTGSSAMPHKKNPVLCENVCGLMRTAKSMFTAVLQNQVLWHERDISHSSSERIVFSDVFSLMDFALERLREIITNLWVSKENMQMNLDAVKETIASQRVLTQLMSKGVPRKKAYELVQKSAQARNFKDELIKNQVLELLSSKELEACFISNKGYNLELFYERVQNNLESIL